MAGELKMMSPVAYDPRSVPSRAISYTLPSCDPMSTEPSPATAGDDTIGPLDANVHQMAGLAAGSTNGERPRCVGPNRNIDSAGSIAYCGSDTAGPSPGAPTDGRVASAGQTQRPASHRRFSLQSLSPAHGLASTWAQPEPIIAARERTTAAQPARRGASPRPRGAAGDRHRIRMAQG